MEQLRYSRTPRTRPRLLRGSVESALRMGTSRTGQSLSADLLLLQQREGTRDRRRFRLRLKYISQLPQSRSPPRGIGAVRNP